MSGKDSTSTTMSNITTKLCNHCALVIVSSGLDGTITSSLDGEAIRTGRFTLSKTTLSPLLESSLEKSVVNTALTDSDIACNERVGIVVNITANASITAKICLIFFTPHYPFKIKNCKYNFKFAYKIILTLLSRFVKTQLLIKTPLPSNVTRVFFTYQAQ